jgi:hypothetical protein
MQSCSSLPREHPTAGQSSRLFHARKLALIAVVTASSLMMLAGYFYAYGQDKSEFPDGFDAVQAAPNSHKVIFEKFVRVLEVTVPPPTIG